MSARLIRHADYRRARWKNDGGWTTELAVGGDPASFDWRVSIADVEADGTFSSFPDCDRHIALLEGAGMRIEFDDAPALRLEQRLRFARFAGEANARGRPLGGPVRDFNVIVRRDAFRAEVLHRPLVGPMVFLADAAVTWFVYVVTGFAELKDSAGMRMDTGESLLLEPDEAARNRVMVGGGEVVLVKLTRL